MKLSAWAQIYHLLRKSINQGLDDNVARLGAALAFYALLSVVPMLVLLASAATALYGTEVARDQIYELVAKFSGRQQAETIEGLLDAVSQHTDIGSKTAIFNLVILIYGASSFFTQLQESLNLIWKIPTRTEAVFLYVLRDRLAAFLMVFALGFATIMAILGNTVLTIAIHVATGFVPVLAELVQGVNLFLNFFVLACIFAFLFKYIPDQKIAWSDVRGGAMLTAFLFTAGQYIINVYLSHAAFIASYGAAGSIVALLIWSYYSAQIFFFGAEFTQAYARRNISRKDEWKPEV